MNQTFLIGSALTAFAFGSAAQSAFVIGSINFSSGPDGGVILQDSEGIATTHIPDATGIQSWLSPQADLRSGSFLSVPHGQSVSFPLPWVFTSSTSPLWSIPVPDNFTFHLSDSTVEVQTDFLLISGTGTLTGTGYDDTPATWFFSTQGVATDGKFSWSSSTTAIPELGTPALLSATLIGVCFIRRRDPTPFSPK